MTQPTKYYTPTIEEFHVGFEFEMNDTWGGWKKLTLTKELLENPMVALGSGNERVPYYHSTRVKYLDKEDIENLGFELKRTTGNHQFHYEKDKDSFAIYNLTHVLSHNIIRITKEDKNMFEEYENYLFNGIIKNKSELRVLLKQLNI